MASYNEDDDDLKAADTDAADETEAADDSAGSDDDDSAPNTPADDDDSAPKAPSTDDAARAAPATPSVRDYIAKKFGLDSSASTYGDLSDKALAGAKSAQQDARDTKNVNGILNGFTTAFGGTHNRKANDAYFAGKNADADKQAALSAANDQQLVKNYLTGNTLGMQDQQRAQQQKDWDFKNQQNQRTADLQKEHDDPTSAASKALRDTIRQIGVQLPDTVSYSDAEKMYPHLISAYEASQGRIEAAKTRAAMLQDSAANRAARAKEVSDAKADKQESDDLSKAQWKMNSDTADLRKQVDQANSIDSEIDEAQKNPVAAQSIPIRLARLATGGGRINNAEIAKLGGSQAILARAKQAAQNMANGTLTDENYKFMKDLARVVKQGSVEALKQRRMMHAAQMTSRTGQTLEDAYSDLTGGEELYPLTVKDAKGNTATVSNEEDYNDAKAHGFQ